MKIHPARLQEQLQSIGFDAIARATGFEHARTKKITAFGLLVGFFLLYSRKLRSLEDWACCIGQVLDITLSKQAVALKVKPCHGDCFEAALKALSSQRLPALLARGKQTLLERFQRVLAEDSTCAALAARLAQYFPSSHNKAGRVGATVRMRWVFDLRSEQVIDYAMKSFRDNDQGQAGDILPVLKPGDLLLRDLGYFSIARLRQIAEAKAYFVSRLRYGVHVSSAATGEELDLVALARSSQHRIDLEVVVGKRERVRMRLIGERLPEQQAASRRRKARTDRHAKACHSEDYLQWLGWSFYVTNVPPELCAAEEISQLYRLRWRVEMWFKALKSGLNTERLLSASMPYERARLVLLAIALYVMLVIQPAYRYFVKELAEQGRWVSLLRFIAWLQLYLEQLLAAADLAPFVAQVRQHCCYDKRRNRVNFYDLCQYAPIP